MTINGKIIDDVTGQPVPRATISLYNSNLLLTSTAANDDGNFSISTNQIADSLAVTSIGYQGVYWPLPTYQTNTVFELPVSTTTDDTIVIEYKPKKKSFLGWIVLLGTWYLLNDKYGKKIRL